MSLYGTMNTAVSGMNAQSNRLSVVGENIANADTTGYKRASVEFSSLILPSTAGNYSSGSLNAVSRHEVSEEGGLTDTSSAGDIAIQGRGFFIVEGSNGVPCLTRAGSFRVDDSGDLVNAGGFALMGQSLPGGLSTQINGLTGLVRVNLANGGPQASPTRNINLAVNLDARKPVVPAAQLPGTNAANAQYTTKTSVTAYDNLGRAVIYDIYYTKKADAAAGPPATQAQWDVAVYRKDQADPGMTFPYTGSPLVQSTATVSFDSNTGKITASPNSLTITDNKAVPSQTIALNLAGSSQIGTDYSVVGQKVDGNAAAQIDHASVDTDGTVYAVYTDGTRAARFRIPLADVTSPDNLEPEAGNVYSQSARSGNFITGFPGEGSFGKTLSGKLEKSNVDMATELTVMIQAQRSYTANSKVFQTGADLMDILVNLKR